MTPAINTAKKAKITFEIHEYVHDANAPSFGEEAAEKLGVATERVFKTLVVRLDTGKLAVAVVPVSTMLNLKLIAKAARAKKAAMAEPADVERSTGYVLGGVSPLGQKRPLPTFIDASAENFPTIFISAGKRGLDIEMQPKDLVTLSRGSFASLTQ